MLNSKITQLRSLSGDDVRCFFHDPKTHELSLLVTFPWITLDLTKLKTMRIVNWELKMADKLIVSKNYENKLLFFWDKVNLITFNTSGIAVERSRFAEYNVAITELRLKQDNLLAGSARTITLQENKIYDCSELF